MTDIVQRAREYLAANAAESGADVLIEELIVEVEGLRKQFLESVTSILSKVKENNEIIKDAERRLDRAGL